MLAAGDSAAPITFDYDHRGMRVKKIPGGTGRETRYLYDERSVLLEYGGSTAAQKTFHKYDYGYGLLSLTEVDTTGQNRRGQFYLTDDLMSTSNLTDDGGALIQSYRYDAWGRVRDQAGSSDNPRQYTAHYTDSETGLHYFGARYYDDETGRFLSQDAYLGEETTPPSLHRYLYAYANPLRFVDLTGYQTIEANPGAPITVSVVDPGAAMATGNGAAGTVQMYKIDQWSNGENERLAETGKKLLGDISVAWAKQVEAVRAEVAERERRIRGRARALEEARRMPLKDSSENAPTGAWAGDLARRYERWVGKLEEHFDNWVGENPSLLKNIVATATLSTAQALDVFFVSNLKLGESIAEKGVWGVPEDLGRALSLVDFLAPVLKGVAGAITEGRTVIGAGRSYTMLEGPPPLGVEAEMNARAGRGIEWHRGSGFDVASGVGSLDARTLQQIVNEGNLEIHIRTGGAAKALPSRVLADEGILPAKSMEYKGKTVEGILTPERSGAPFFMRTDYDFAVARDLKTGRFLTDREFLAKIADKANVAALAEGRTPSIMHGTHSTAWQVISPEDYAKIGGPGGVVVFSPGMAPSTRSARWEYVYWRQNGLRWDPKWEVPK